MRFRVTRFGSGFEVIMGDVAVMVHDHTIISYRAVGLPAAINVLTGRESSFLEVSEDTPRGDLIYALMNEIW